MVSFTKVLITLAAAASAVVAAPTGGNAADGSAGSLTLSGLQQIDKDTVTLGNADRAYDGSIQTVIPLVTGVTQLYSDIQLTAKVTEVLGQFNAQQANAIISFINSPLNPDTNSTIAATKANKASIAQAGLTPVVEAQFVQLQTAVKELSSAILDKTPNGQKAAAQKVLNTYQGYYQDAVTFFSS